MKKSIQTHSCNVRQIVCLCLGMAFPFGTAPPAALADDPRTANGTDQPKNPAKNAAKNADEALFDGKSLDGWKETDFAGRGEVKVKDGQLVLGFGQMLTGITYAGKPPKSNYQITLEAKRIDGSDFFCGLTFPVGDGFCTLILGGWGGSLCGLSCLNGSDASENETTYFERFEHDKWYKIRVRVTDAKVEAWVGDKRTINVDRKGIEFNVRWEVELSEPLGIASFQTTAAYRNVRLRKIKPEHEPKGP